MFWSVSRIARELRQTSNLEENISIMQKSTYTSIGIYLNDEARCGRLPKMTIVFLEIKNMIYVLL